MILPIDKTEVPSASNHEARLLSCIALDALQGEERGCFRKAKALGVTEESFYQMLHRRMWVAAENMDGTFDELTMAIWMRDHEENCEPDGLIQDLMGVLNSCETTFWFDHWLEVVLETQAKREYRHMGMEVAELATQGATMDEMADVLEKKPKGVMASTGLVDKDATARAATERILALKNSGKNFLGLSTGVEAWDNTIYGLRECTLNVVGARPGLGKTSIALQVALNVALQNQRVHFWSCEMSPEQLHFKLALSHSQTDFHKAKEGMLGPEQYRNFEYATKAIAAMPIEIPKVTNITTNMVAGLLHKDIALNSTENRPKLVIIDYLQLMIPTNRALKRDQQIEEMSRDLKNLALDTGVPILLLAQINRDAEKEHRNPRPSDLRGSGAIEQDADTITFLHTKNGDDPMSLRLIVAKNREDSTGECVVTFNKRISKIY